MTVFVLHCDGGSRGNPGPAAIGVVLEEEMADGRRVPVEDVAEVIGVATNNVAEYRALLRGLEEARRRDAAVVRCFLDSQLVVEQMNGRYQVRKAELKPLHDAARRLTGAFEQVTFTHVPRERNAGADRLVNQALDAAAGLSPAELAAGAPTVETAGPRAGLAPPPGAEAAEGWRRLVRPGSTGVDVKPLHQEGRRVVALLRFAPGGAIDQHAAEVAVDVVCLEGEGKVSVTGDTRPIRAGDLVHWPANSPHRLWSEGEAMTTLMLEGWG